MFESLRWNGNSLGFTDGGANLLLPALGIIAILVMFFVSSVKNTIHKNFNNYIATTSGYRVARISAISLSLFMIFIFALRIVIYSSSSSTGTPYPFTWELIPLHYTRLCLVLNFIILLSRPKFIKESIVYYGMFSIVTGIIAILLPDLGGDFDRYGTQVKWGYDSYTYWDYAFIHIINIIVPWTIFILYKPTITFKKASLTLLYLVICLVILFSIDSALFYSFYDPNNKETLAWSANWGYVAPDPVNPFASGLYPPATSYPFAILSLLAVFSLFHVITFSSYISSDSLSSTIEGKWKIKWVKTKNSLWTQFKQTTPKFTIKTKK